MRHGTDPFQVPMAILEEGSNRLRLEGTAEDVGLSPSEAMIQGTVVLEGDFYRSDMQVEIQARVRAVFAQACDRCLEPVTSPIEAPLRLYCERRDERDRRTELDRRAEDVGLLYHDGRVLDLRVEIREVILLEAPWHPLCRPDCMGLCPRCGKDRNRGDCGCPPERSPSPWDALRGIPGGGATPAQDPREEV